MNFEVGVVGVGLTGEERLDLVGVGPLGEPGEAVEPVGHDRIVTLGLAELDELDRVGHLRGDLVDGADRAFEPAPLAHDVLGVLGIVPQRRVLDAGVELVEAAHRAVPVERAAHQRQRRLDPVDMGLPLGTH